MLDADSIRRLQSVQSKLELFSIATFGVKSINYLIISQYHSTGFRGTGAVLTIRKENNYIHSKVVSPWRR